MSDSSSKLPGPGFLWPAAVVAVWSLYGVLNYTAPLDTPRPQQLPGGEAETQAEDSVRTPFVRLWDDPLGPSYFAPGTVQDTMKKVPLEFDGDLLLLPVCLPGGPGSEARETRLRMRNAILAALTTAKYRPLSSERLKHLAVDLKPDAKPESREASATSLPPPKPAAPILVPYERFRRDETDSLYDAEDDPEFGEIVVCWVDESRLGNRPLESLGRLLQAVIDQCSPRIAASSQKPADRPQAVLKVRIVGPSCTDTLLAMARDWSQLRAQSHRPFPLTMADPGTLELPRMVETTFFSARATVEPAALKRDDKAPLREFTDPPSSAENSPAPGRAAGGTPFSFVRVIGTDWHLAHTIRRELEQRGQWPRPHEPNECVVLITERDTLYGRALPNLFRFLFPKESLTQSPAPLVAYKYLRGIDGKRTDATIAPRAASGDGSAAASDTPSGFNPTGTAQLDYLRRLEAQLVALHQRQCRAGGRGILAIGVTGTDVYDKLLILRAVRNRFPGVSFFTTDLDAEFWRPSELRYTQNLIVAAHFGLQLHPSLQRDVLPFRDSYQTSCFLATLLAVDDQRAARLCQVAGGQAFWPEPPLRDDDQAKIRAETDRAKQQELREGAFEWFEKDPYADTQGDPASGLHQSEPTTTAVEPARKTLQPLSFEIGRRGAYQMTLTGAVVPATPAFDVPARDGESLTALVQPPSPREWRHYPPRWWLALSGCVLLSLLFLSLYLYKVRGPLRQTLGAVRRLSRLFWIPCRSVRCGVRPRGRDPAAAPETRPRACWRTLGRRVARLRLQLRWQSREAAALAGLVAVMACGVALGFAIYHNHQAPDGEPFVCLEGISIWPSTLIRFIAAVLGVVFLFKAVEDLRANGKRLFGKNFVAPDSNKRATPRSWTDRVRRRTTLGWTAGRDTETLLEEYAVKCRGFSHFVRVVPLTISYVALTFLLFVVAEAFPNCPARNQCATTWANAFTFLSVVACVSLVFFTVDSIHLCNRFVGLVGSARCVWPPQTLNAVTPGRAGPDEDRQSLATIRVIGQLTNEVSKVQLYPFVALLILICARHSRFDGWNLPWPLLTVMLMQFLVLILSSLALRKAAAKARRFVLGRLQTDLANAIGTDGPREKQLQQVIAEIQRESDGAYRPLGDDYLFRALAIPFGGTGGLLLLDQLINWM